MQTSTVTIRPIGDVAQMRDVEELQKEVWGIPDLDVVPLTHLVAAKEAGGTLIGAYDDETLVGFVYGFPSFERSRPAHHSHMLAVKRDYRNHDLGRRLKFAQREQVLTQGIEVITWTFDPLQSLNAYFNFSKLGVVSDQYFRDFYGVEAASFLHQTGTDRLWVSWLLRAEHVKQTISGAAPAKVDRALPLVSVADDFSPRRNNLADCLASESISIEIPGDINSLQHERPQTASQWREATRWAFTEALRAGYLVVGFTRAKTTSDTIGKYLLSRSTLDDFAL
jgi:predicted GNAT superfamily acetyltransferase